MQTGILLFVKYPEPGKVKTRLAATVGIKAAAEIYRKLVTEVCRRLPGEDGLVVMYDPPERGNEIAQWLEPLLGGRPALYWPQGPGDLGTRLSRAFEMAFDAGFQSVAVIGSDCIDLDAAIFQQAWAALSAFDGVIGPSVDGGYYLLALRAPSPALFAGINWSTNAVFAQTMDRARRAGLRLEVLPMLHDVDCEADWHKAQERLVTIA